MGSAYSISVSEKLTEDLTKWRSTKDESWARYSKEPLPTNYGRIFLAEVAYALLFVASLVETAVRGVFFIPGIVIAYSLHSCCRNMAECISYSILTGTVLSFANSLACIVALFDNITHKDLHYHRDLEVIHVGTD